jgi:glycosyltransferase involved in cell wall biosynthesis
VATSLAVLAVVALPPWRTGAARVCATLIEALAARGHRIHALAPITADARPAAWRSAAGRAGPHVTWYPVPLFEPFAHLVSDEHREAEIGQVRRWLDARVLAERPDVLLVGREIHALPVASVAREAGIPTLLISHAGPILAIAHGTWPAGPTRQLLDSPGQIDLIIAPARHWAATLRQLGVSRIGIIQNPVDLARFAPRPPDPTLARRLGLAPDALVVLHASNLQAVKRPMDLVASAARAVPLDPRLVYLVVGDGPQRGAMEREAHRLGLSTRFRFVGWVDHQEMPELPNLADIVVMMSEHETQALVYLEAQGGERALLASDVPGAREVVRDGETGVLFQTGDVAELAERTLKRADAAAWRAELGRQAPAAVASRALPDVVTLYEQALDAVVRQNRRRTR